MKVENTVYYLSQKTNELRDSDFIYNNTHYLYRIQVNAGAEIVAIENKDCEYTRIQFENLVELRDTLNKIIDDIVHSAVGGKYAMPKV